MEKTKRSNKLLKVTLSVVALILVAAVTYGITMAFLTAKSNDKTNVFTSGDNVDITINEPKYDQIEDYTYKPGDIQDKDPSVENLKEAAYVAMTVEFYAKEPGAADYTGPMTYGDFKAQYANIGIEKDSVFAAGEFNPQWYASADNSDTSTKLVFYYKGSNQDNTLKAVDKGGKTEELFTKVKFNDDIETVVNAAVPEVRIDVKAYAVQTTGTSVDDLNDLMGI